jgi:peptide/nickel transport system substrate-binding protein
MGNVENLEVLGLKAASGEFDFQDRHLGVTNLPVLVENQQRGNYTIYRAPSTELDLGLRINLAYEEDPEIGELIRNVNFRRGLSLGINRDQINEAFFLGTSTPTATMAADGSIYNPGPEWRTRWATHDVAQANTLLDQAGLTAKDGAGFRLRRDGKGRVRLNYEVATGFVDFTGIGEMIRNQWAQIGIELNIQSIEGNLLIQRTVANKLMLSAHQVGTDDPFLKADTFLPTVTNNYPGMIGIPYALWFTSNGTRGKEPPESMRLLKDAMTLLRQGLSAPEDERRRIGKELYKLHADQVWSIGIVGFGLAQYGVYLASNKLRNVPKRVINSLQTRAPANAFPMTFYYE